MGGRGHLGRVFAGALLSSLVAIASAGAAESELCDVHYFGIGVEKDFARALACEMAEPEERRDWLLLAVMHVNGEGTPRDLRRAREALGHLRPDSCGASCAVLREILRRQEAAPAKKHPRVDFCKDVAVTTPDANYCLGIEARKRDVRHKRQARALAVDLSPEARKKLAALEQALAAFKKADGLREYENFREGTIRSEASEEMQARVAKHYQAALAAWGPKSTQPAVAGRPLAEADRELNEVYRGIMDGLNAGIAEAQAAPDSEEKKTRVEDETRIKTTTRDAQRAWLRYAEAWKAFVKSLRPGDAEALEGLRAFLTEQRIRELKYPSIGEASATDPQDN